MKDFLTKIIFRFDYSRWRFVALLVVLFQVCLVFPTWSGELGVESEQGRKLFLYHVQFGYGAPDIAGNKVRVGASPGGKADRMIVGSILDFRESLQVPLASRIRFGVRFKVPEIETSDRIELEVELELPPSGPNIRIMKKKLYFEKKDSGHFRMIQQTFHEENPLYFKPGYWLMTLLQKGKRLAFREFFVYPVSK